MRIDEGALAWGGATGLALCLLGCPAPFGVLALGAVYALRRARATGDAVVKKQAEAARVYREIEDLRGY